MRHYETTFIMRPNLGEAQFTEIIERTSTIITDHGGAIIDLDRWGMRRLAYEIKKEVQGYYVYLNYATVSEAISEMERIFRLDDRMLRYLTIKLADAIDQQTLEQEKERIAAAKAGENEEPEPAARETTDESSPPASGEAEPAKATEEQAEEQDATGTTGDGAA